MPNTADPDAAKTAAIKSRIIKHMNADHQASLTQYLEHYCKIPSRLASTAQLDDIELSYLIISSSNGQTRNLIPLSPPMASWSEARERMVVMHHEALTGLGLSDITVTEYRAPRNFHALVFGVCLWTYISFSRRANFLPGRDHFNLYPFWSVLGYLPSLAEFCYIVQPLIIVLMVAIHAVEATFMVRSRLRKHVVEVFSVLWWTWVGSSFIEGYGAFQRFDAIVKEKEDKKKAEKH